MRIFKIDRNNPDRKIISLAAKIIKSGGIVIYPTDTIYGIGASALNENAVKKIYEIKGRKENKPLSVIVSDMKMAKKYCRINKAQQEIFTALLPGPFTLVLPKKHAVKIFARGEKTLAIRTPELKITKMLAMYLKIPFTATSANISGLPGSGDIKKILKQLKNKKNQIDLVLDAGVLPKRKPSTIIDLTAKKPKVIRK